METRECPVCRRERGKRRGMPARMRHLHELEEGDTFTIGEKAGEVLDMGRGVVLIDYDGWRKPNKASPCTQVVPDGPGD